MHMKILYNERERQTQRLTSVSVSTQTDPVIQEMKGWCWDRTTKTASTFGTPQGHSRVLAHPAKSNYHHRELWIRLPDNPRTNVPRHTFYELHDALNRSCVDTSAEPDVNAPIAWEISPEHLSEYLPRSTIEGEDSSSWKIIMAFAHSTHTNPSKELYCVKVVIFDTSAQQFIFRTCCSFSTGEKWGYSSDKVSQDPEWFVDTSKTLAYKPFWARLKEIINSI